MKKGIRKVINLNGNKNRKKKMEHIEQIEIK
jgi:hypothetical protein